MTFAPIIPGAQERVRSVGTQRARSGFVVAG